MQHNLGLLELDKPAGIKAGLLELDKPAGIKAG